MTEREGVTKFDVTHTHAACVGAPIAAFASARARMTALCVVGADPTRYDGVGFGNLSVRAPRGGFWITGTQTGHVASFGTAHVCLVDHATPAQNAVHSRGPCRPSSEAMTHAVVYACLPEVGAVIHGHDSVLWASGMLPATPAHVQYGTPEMADAVRALVTRTSVRAFAMAGHEDGVVVMDATLEAAAARFERISRAAR
jgi:L-ribulose-5-phosphate 4-epimerase